MAGITQVKIRAKVTVGSLFSVVTPFVQSFNVRKQRGQIGSFDTSLKVSSSQVKSTIAGSNIQISAGEGSPELIFTGVVRSARISPCFDDPDYVILSLSGVDTLSLLQGKKYTRRCRASKTGWCAITGVVRRGLKSGKFTYKSEPILYKEAIVSSQEDNRVAAAPQGPTSGVGVPLNEKENSASVAVEQEIDE